MIIDLILNRKEGSSYDAKTFYNEVTNWGSLGIIEGFKIAEALDSGENADVKRELAKYIINQEYNLNIISYINSVNWL